MNASLSVTVVVKSSIEFAPPTVSAALLLAELGCSVRIICPACAPATRDLLTAGGVASIDELLDVRRPHPRGGKLATWVRFHRAAWAALASTDPSDLLWIASGDTALALGPSLLRRRYVLHLRELYDAVPHYRAALRWYARAAAAVVVPEYCRAHILRSWYGLPTTPIILPNRPHYHPRQRGLKLPAPAAELLAESVDDRIVLYQGHLGANRDLTHVARAVTACGDPWRLVVMGPSNAQTLASLRTICPDMVVLPFIPTPQHLAVTSHAYIGIVNYSHRTLNEVFCAPNKIWEYTGFGVPCLCGDLPGLAWSVAAKGAGVCCDMSDELSIGNALQELHDGWFAASDAATAFFDSVDCRATMARVLAQALSASANPVMV